MMLRQWLEEGPFTLTMSAGFFSFYSHCGFVKALFEAGYRPQKITGASAGALIGGLLAAGLEPLHIQDILHGTRKEDFWDVKWGMGLLEGKRFEKLLSQYIPQTFAELKKSLVVSAFDMKKFKSKIFAEGDLRASIRASCCFPLLFHPVKVGERHYLDGGLGDWAGLQGVDGAERCLVHMIEPAGFMAQFWRKRAYARVQEDHKVLVLPESIKMGPHRMHLAEEAIEASYRQTQKLLQ